MITVSLGDVLQWLLRATTIMVPVESQVDGRLFQGFHSLFSRMKSVTTLSVCKLVVNLDSTYVLEVSWGVKYIESFFNLPDFVPICKDTNGNHGGDKTLITCSISLESKIWTLKENVIFK